MGKCCLHFFDWSILEKLLQNKLKQNGAALFYAISGETTKLFGNEEFNQIFMNNFTDAPYSSKFNVVYYVTEEQMKNMALHRCWSTHQHLTDDEIKKLVELVPTTGKPLKMMVDVNCIMFTPAPNDE